MAKGKILTTVALVVLGLGLASCGNTIKGMGEDTANTIDATKDAGQSIDNAVK